jgi:hypothetical protein
MTVPVSYNYSLLAVPCCCCCCHVAAVNIQSRILQCCVVDGAAMHVLLVCNGPFRNAAPHQSTALAWHLSPDSRLQHPKHAQINTSLAVIHNA